MSLLFSFFGRIGRGGWWLGVLANLILALGAAALAYFVFGPQMSAVNPDGTLVPMGVQPGPDAKLTFNALSIAITAVGYVLAVWVSIATSVKRLHDRGKSGWWFLLMAILSVIVVGTIWMLIELGILEGQTGPNKYGDDPRSA